MKGHLRERKKGSGSWSIVIYAGKDQDGKKKYDWHSFKGNRKAAEAELTRLIHGKNTGAYIEPNRQTVGQHLEQWLNDYARSNVAPKTLHRYTEIVQKHLIPALGNTLLAKLTPSHITGYYSQALQGGRRNGKGGLSPQTVLHHHRVLRQALQHAVKWQKLVANPANSADPPRASRREMRVFSKAELAQILDATRGHWLHMPVLVSAMTAMRQGEILALTWLDVDLKTGTLSIKKAKTPTGRRSVRIEGSLVDVLRRHKARQAEMKLKLGGGYQDNGLVCAGDLGQPLLPHSVTQAFERLIKRLGMPHGRFHDLRHTHATMLLSQGVHPKMVSDRLGHATIAITLDTYSHVLPDMQQEAARKIDDLLGDMVRKSQQG